MTEPAQQPSSKPITAAFDLQTKIRVIIQQVLAATMRKISQFHEKVETFQKFFFTYTQRVNDMEEKGKNNQQSFIRLYQSVAKNKQNAQSQFIKFEQKHEKLRLQKNQLEQDIRQINRKISTINRQNESITNEFSNTRKKFLEYSQQITAMKQQVAWKITRYVEQTAQINTKIQINNEEIKKQYFNINLALQKNKQKYQEIIKSKDIQENLNQKYTEAIEMLENSVRDKGEQIVGLHKKIDEMDTALYAKIKSTQMKLDKKIQQLFQSNNKIQQSVAKVDGFSKLLQEIRQDSEKVRRQLMKKFEQTDQKHNDRIQKQVLAINMNILNYQKTTDKKIRTLSQTQQKNVDFFNQKMQYLKIEIQAQISSKATRMLQQKSKSQSGAATSLVAQLQQKMNKLSLEVKKQVNKVENSIKDIKLEIKHQLEDVKEAVETRITNTVKAIQESSGSGVSPEFIQSINEKIQKVMDSADLKLTDFSKEILQQNLRIKSVESMKDETQKKFKLLNEQNTTKFEQLEQKISNKVERVLYTVTKMRGDAIIRNQFTDKQIKQLKKVQQVSSREISTVLKLFPAIGQCINLVMCLIFDAQFQHAKIIQDNLPSPTKNTVKFQNLVQGVLYQFVQKRKPGTITYRHKQQKKIDIVRATFNGYIQIWQQLFDNDFKSRQQFIPKTFYKKYVQRTGTTSRNSPTKQKQKDKQQSQPINISKQLGSRQLIGNASDGSRENLLRGQSQGNGNGNSDNLNRSFHIRKKKTSTIRTKDDLIMVVQQNVREEK